MDGTNVLNGSSARRRRSHVHPIRPAALNELIEKVEQRVSESCAALCDHLQTIQQFGENGYGCEAAITRGEWRKHMKGD